MKKTYVFFAALFSLNYYSQAQDLEIIDSLTGSYEDQVQEVFQFVDLNQVPNGILYEYGFQLQSFENFDGTLTVRHKTLKINSFMLKQSVFFIT